MTNINEYIMLADQDHMAARWLIKDESFWLEVLRVKPEYKGEVVFNKKLPDQILSVLSLDPDPRIRLIIATKNRLPLEVFERLSCDIDEGVREAIARHKKTPRNILERLRNDDSVEIVQIVNERLNNDSSHKA